MVFGGANTTPNNGDEQDATKNAELMDGQHTSGTAAGMLEALLQPR